MARLIRLEATQPRALSCGERTVWLCQCGLSQNFPMCDGSHSQAAKEEPGKLCLYDGRRCKVLAVLPDRLEDVAVGRAG